MNKPEKIKSRDRETAEFEKAVREGIDSLDAGKGVSYTKIRRWLLSWGTKNELPPTK
jgi:predicted transcriptional regulator